MGDSMKFEDLFMTQLQTKIIQILLENPDRVFSTMMIAKILQSSPSAVLQRLNVLERLGIVKVLYSGRRLKLYQLNKESKVVRILLKFYKELRELKDESTKSA